MAPVPPMAPVATRPTAPGTDGFAIASFVLGVLSAIPLAVIFGIVALVRIGRTRQAGQGFAVAGLVLSGVWLLAIGGLIGFAAAGHRLDSGSPGQIAQTDLRVGDCLELPRAVPQVPRSFSARDCALPHNGEVFRVGALPAGTYPGEAAAADTVLRTCQDRMSAFLGGESANNLLHVVYIYPTSTSWDAGQRRYVCIAVDREKDITGSMSGLLSGT